MSIKSELSVLKVNIQNAKDKLYTNLVDKGVIDITTASTLNELADSVSGITVGGSSEGGSIGTKFICPERISFENSSGTTQIDLSLFDTSNVTSMQSMFYKCKSLTSLDLSNFDTSNVTTMSYLFRDCNNLTSLNISNFDTSNVTNMGYMFGSCGNLTSLDLSNLDTSNVTNMGCMFESCKSLTSLDLSNFNTSNVTTMQGMFGSCSGLTSLNLSNFDTSNVTNMGSMFSICGNLTSLDLSNFNTSKVTNMDSIFNNCGKLTKVDGYISFKSYSSSTMSNRYFLGYSSNSSLRKITFKDIGYHSNATQFNMSYATVWGVNSDTITDARQSLVDSLITYSFDRATNGYSTCTVTLEANTKAVLTEDEIAAITAKGFTIA